MYLTEKKFINSRYLDRQVTIDAFFPASLADARRLRLLVINDAQDMEKLQLMAMLNEMHAAGQIGSHLFAVGIHAGDRLMEFGTSSTLDYMGRGYKAKNYSDFIIHELIPYLLQTYQISSFNNKAIAGFSLGGLSAMDITWANPEVFDLAGVFSGSLWWRSKALDEGYIESEHRIMHNLVRTDKFKKGLRFFFEAGALDETADRNNNGIIDSIDDTLGLISELERKGYKAEKDLRYLEIPDGRHDVETWARAMPHFLAWGWPPAAARKGIRKWW